MCMMGGGHGVSARARSAARSMDCAQPEEGTHLAAVHELHAQVQLAGLDARRAVDGQPLVQHRTARQVLAHRDDDAADQVVVAAVRAAGKACRPGVSGGAPVAQRPPAGSRCGTRPTQAAALTW